MSFNLIRINVFPIGEDNEFLTPPGDEQVPAGIEIAEVARVEPAVFKRGLGGVGTVPIALHDDGAADQDFAHGVADFFGGLGIENFRLDGRQRRPDRANHNMARPIEKGGSGSFGQPVSVEQVDAEIVEVAGDHRIKARPASDEIAHARAERGMDFSEE